MNIGIVKDMLDLRASINSTFFFFRPMWIKLGMTNVQQNVLRRGDFRDNRSRESHISCRGLNKYLFTLLRLLPSLLFLMYEF